MGEFMSSFGDWEFTCDRQATLDSYARAAYGGADRCSCNGCRNFIVAPERAFPLEFLKFLDSLGIDSRKDGEVYHNARLATGLHDYGGWFHFVGKLLETGDFPVVGARTRLYRLAMQEPCACVRGVLRSPSSRNSVSCGNGALDA